MTFYRRPLKQEPQIPPPVKHKKDYTLWMIAAISLICAGWIIYNNIPESHGPNEAAPYDPVIRITNGIKSFQYNNFMIKPVATIQMTALILSVTNYKEDAFSEISPVDFAVGWGRMSDPYYLKNVAISQSERWAYWRWNSRKDFTNDDQYYIDTHSRNIHIIPSSSQIADVIFSVKPKDVVKISGYLISASSYAAGNFVSGLRNDVSGGGSCFIIWVKEISVLYNINELA